MTEHVTPRRVFRRLAAAGALSALTLTVLTACNDGAAGTTPTATNGATAPATNEATAPNQGTAPAARATLRTAEDSEVGTATFTEVDGALRIETTVTGMEAGFYGFHIHGIGVCEADSAAPDNPQNTGDFLSAGGHLGADQGDHPDHQGDLPSLLVMDNGEGQLTFTTDRVSVADLTDDDGAALMVHSGRDNFANVPERYAEGGPDDATRGTGDAGARLACGVIE